MTLEILTALIAFAFASSITPGPNNLMLMTSGANFGFRRSIPHMLGIGIGFTFMVVLVGTGLMQVFDTIPYSYAVLKCLSAVYLLYLAWKISQAGPVRAQGAEARPMTFLEAATFQWVNPKAWAMALTAISAYSPDRSMSAVLLVALVFGAVNLPSVGTWTVLGQQMARFLTDPHRLTLFNRTMALLLVASLYPLLLSI
ncbi:LysE family translocator [Primorskyibacter sp. S87]|uniref:LysE family translocator n=1 Tax=Primorskyibacter sp. S87 TaxID=3415126 RepID=UPI003C79BEC6